MYKNIPKHVLYCLDNDYCNNEFIEIFKEYIDGIYKCIDKCTKGKPQKKKIDTLDSSIEYFEDKKEVNFFDIVVDQNMLNKLEKYNKSNIPLFANIGCSCKTFTSCGHR